MSFKLKRSKNQLEERRKQPPAASHQPRESLCVKSDLGGVVTYTVYCTREASSRSWITLYFSLS